MKLTGLTALLSLQSASVLAAPITEGNSVLSARDTDLYYNANGFAIVEYGDGLLNYGARVPSTILDIIRDECGETSCSPSGGYGFSTLVVTADRESYPSYTIDVEGTFNLDGYRGSKDQLLDLAKKGFEDVYTEGVAKRRQGVKYIKNPCPNYQPVCPGQSADYTDQWESIDHINVRINDDDGTLLGFLNVGVRIDGSGSGSGACGALAAASAGAGLVSSAASIGLSMLSISCGYF